MPIFAVLIQRYIRTSSGKFNFKLIPPIITTDEYQSELKSILDEKNKTVITIIDDLDRLTPEKIVEALDAIKAFVNYRNCIFIVPFDDSILKSALRKKGVHFNNNENLTIENDLFLDKLFQYKVYLPNIILSNIPEYTIKISHNEVPDLCRLCGQVLFDKICREILIHKNVTTPRQAKKIINAFANNLLLAHRREDGHLAIGTLTSEEGIKVLAKISVLQADYSGFYSKLFQDPLLVEDFIVTSESDEITYFNELLLPYFEFIEESDSNNKYRINKEYESLLNFLKRTSNIKCNDISKYLYLSKDKNSIKFGDELSRSLKNSITSGTTKLAKSKLEENKSKNLVELLNDILLYAEVYEYDKCVTVLINVYEYYKKLNCVGLLNNIGEKTSAIYNSNGIIDNNEISFLNLIEIYLLSSDKSGLDRLICESLKNQNSKIIEKLEIFFIREHDFSEKAKIIIRDYISNKLGQAEKVTLQEFFDINSINITRDYKMYFSNIDIVDLIIKYLYDNEIFNKNNRVYIALVELVELNCKNGKCNEVIEKLLTYLNDERVYLMFADILNSYANKFTDTMATLIASELFKIENEDLYDNINELLLITKWHITEESKENADKYVKENYRYQNIDNILLKIIENSDVKYIPKSINNINENILNENVACETIKLLQEHYNSSQRDDMFNAIIEQISYAQKPSDKNYNITEKLLNALCNYSNNAEGVNKLTLQIYNQIASYPTNIHCIKALQLLNPVLDIISATNLNNLIVWASNTSYMSSYEIASITILDIMKNKIQRDNYLTIGANVMTYGTVNSLAHSLRLLRILREEFVNGSQQINNYRKFLLKFTDEDVFRKEIIEDICSKYKSIGTVSSYILSVIKYMDIQDMVIKSSIEFLNETKDKLGELKNVISQIEENQIDTLYEIILGIYENKSIEFLETLVTSLTEDDEIKYTFNLMSLLLMKHKECKDNIISKILIMLLENSDISVGINALNKVAQHKKINDNLSKRQIGDAIYTMFTKAADTSDKEKIYLCVKEMEIENSFSKKERKKREFTEDENRLIKIIDKNKAA